LFSKAIGITVGVLARKIGGDAWTAMVIGFLAGTVLMLIMTYLNTKFPDKTIIQYSEEIVGKVVSKFIGLVLALFFAVAFATSANVMTVHLKEYFLLETPFWAICLVFVLLCMYGVFLGIEVAIRFALMGFIGALLITFTMILGTMSDFEYTRLLPLFDRGLVANIYGSKYVFADLTMAILAAGMLLPLLNNNEKVISVTIWSMLVSALLIIIWPVFELGVMGAGAMKQYVVVCMQQVRCAQLTRYLPRYELIMVAFFTFSTFVQSATLFFCSVFSLKQVSGIKKDSYIILPLTVILFIITYLMAYDNNNYALFLSYPWADICTILGISIPLILLALALVRGKLMTGVNPRTSPDKGGAK
jgi:spore germination protein (amino acid permease)